MYTAKTITAYILVTIFAKTTVAFQRALSVGLQHGLWTSYSIENPAAETLQLTPKL